MTEAIITATQDVKENADIESLLNRADKQAELIIRGLLEGSLEDRKLVVVKN